MIVIRHARQNEIGLLAAIGLRAWAKAIAGLADVAGMQSAAERAFIDFLTEHWLSVVLIEDENRICGWGARENHDDTISDLWIDPGAQGRGLGKALLADMEQRMVAEGFDVANARTHAQNASAVTFFQGAGYRVKWLSTAYSQKLDRDMEFIGLSKQLVADPMSERIQ
jgi:ribosomal-protein-alanine N-acetyltransferase